MSLSAYFKYLSPSNVNEFIEYRPKWYLTRILKKKLPDSPQMYWGKAVEGGIAQKLIGNVTTPELASEAGVALFDRMVNEEVGITEKSNELRETIPALVTEGIKQLESLGEMTSMQEKLNIEIENTPLPWVGFTDFTFGDTVIDLKVTGRTPSKMSYGHLRQGAFYKHATNKNVKFLYLIPLKGGVKTASFDIVDHERHLNQLINAACAMERIVGRVNDPDGLRDIFYPNTEDFWVDPETLKIITEVWNIQ